MYNKELVKQLLLEVSQKTETKEMLTLLRQAAYMQFGNIHNWSTVYELLMDRNCENCTFEELVLCARHWLALIEDRV